MAKNKDIKARTFPRNAQIFFSRHAILIEKSPTFQFLDSVVGIEKLVLTFVRAHRERSFYLYILIWSLELIVGYFFALDHYNYSRCVPIHIRDMKSLPDSIREDFKKHWVVAKTSNHFSYSYSY